MMKTCNGCNESKPVTDFAKKRDRLQSRCKSCSNAYGKEYYSNNSERMKADSAAAKKVRMDDIKARIREIKETTPCMDCHELHPWFVMDFDHVRGVKYRDISAMLKDADSWSKLEEEMKKCDLVCSNCHRHRTFGRLGLLPVSMA